MSERNGNEKQEEQEFEQALARSLRRVDAPGDLLARVMAQVEETESKKQEAGRTWSWRDWMPSLGWKPAWGALAAMLVIGVLSGHVVHERRVEEQARARVQASREFDVSVQITDMALEHARQQLRKAGVPLDDDGR